MKNRVRESKTVTFDAKVYGNSYMNRFADIPHFKNAPDELVNRNNLSIAIRWPECLRVVNEIAPQEKSNLSFFMVPDLLTYNGTRLVEMTKYYSEAQDLSATLDHLTTKYTPFLPADVFFADDILSSFTVIKRPTMQRLAGLIPPGKDASLERSCDVYVQEATSEGFSYHVYVDRRAHLVMRYSQFYHQIELMRIDFLNWDFSKTLGSELFETTIPEGMPTPMEFGAAGVATRLDDKDNVRWHQHVLEICEKHGLSHLPTTALKQARERVPNEEDPETRAVYYRRILIDLLKKHGVSVPEMGERDTQN